MGRGRLWAAPFFKEAIQMNDNPAIKGLIELIEKRYGLEVLDSYYVLVMKNLNNII